MSERGREEENLEAFKETFRAGLRETLELAMMLQEPLPVDPYSMGVGERTFEELNPEEKMVAMQIIFAELGLNSKELEKAALREYTTEAHEGATVPGEIKVSVFRTNRKDEGIFLQELTFGDGEKRWVIGPNQDI